MNQRLRGVVSLLEEFVLDDPKGAAKTRYLAFFSRVEIASVFKVGNEPWFLWLPAQQCTRSLTRCGIVESRKRREPTKVVAGFVERLADDGNVQTAADNFSHLSERHTLVSDAMVASSGRILFQGKSEQTCSIEPVHSRPAVEPVVDAGRDALFSRYVDENRDQAMIAIAMDRGRKTNNRHAHLAHCRRICCLFGRCARK